MDSEGVSTQRPTWHDSTSAVAIHPSSILHPLLASQYPAPYLVYSEKMKTSRTFLREVSALPPMALLLFGGSMVVHHDSGYVLLDGWLKVRSPFRLGLVCMISVTRGTQGMSRWSSIRERGMDT